MQKKLLVSLIVTTVLTVPALAADLSGPVKVSAQSSAAGQPKVEGVLSTDKEKLGYVFGYKMGKNFLDHQIDVDANTLMIGLYTGLNGTPPALTPAQMQEILSAFQKELVAKQEVIKKVEGKKNLQEGKVYMKNFVAQKDVQQVVDGKLAYKVLTAGSGPMPTLKDSVMITYDGKLISGRVFDSTKRNGDKPVTLPLSRTISGMQTILTKMPVGSTWEVVIAPELAYGEKGVPFSPIESNETLVFDLSLKAIVPPTPVKPVTTAVH
jgi:FKBP-type peptidyl-prolyl cis-trans isomerase FklB